MPLNLAPLDTPLKIIKIIAEDKTKQHLENLGILPEQTISVVSTSKGNLILKVKEGRIAINRELAMKIFVAIQ